MAEAPERNESGDQAERLEDLDVSDEESDAVKGGGVPTEEVPAEGGWPAF